MDDVEKVTRVNQHPWLADLGSNAKARLNNDAKFRDLLLEYTEAITKRALPKQLDSFAHFGNQLLDLECCELARQAYVLGFGKEDQALIWNNVGFSYVKEHHYKKALSYFRAALQINPRFQLAINNLAAALINQALKLFELDGKDNLDQAEKLLLESLSVKPDHDWALLNLGNVWRKKGSVHKAICWFELALQANPDYAVAHNNLAHAYLTIGDFKKGFAHYEQRWFSSDFPSKLARFTDRAYWDGKENLNGKTILLHWEQGFGDMIQFCRYTFLLKKAYPEARIILETMPPLVGLFEQLANSDGFEKAKVKQTPAHPVDQVISSDRALLAGLKIDFVYPLMSLAKIFTWDEASIPANFAYLVKPRANKSWENFLREHRIKGRRLIGINWAGRPTHGNDKHRSMHLRDLKAFIESKEFSDDLFLSFQDGTAKRQIAELQLESRIIDVSERIKSFSDTAMMLADLDWLISVDSANLHLAGAMGIKSIGLIAVRSDFRWMLGRSDSPWYPSMHLLRQKQELTWDDLSPRMAKIIADNS